MVGFGDYGLVRLLLRLLGLDWRRCEGGLEEAVTVRQKVTVQLEADVSIECEVMHIQCTMYRSIPVIHVFGLQH